MFLMHKHQPPYPSLQDPGVWVWRHFQMQSALLPTEPSWLPPNCPLHSSWDAIWARFWHKASFICLGFSKCFPPIWKSPSPLPGQGRSLLTLLMTVSESLFLRISPWSLGPISFKTDSHRPLFFSIGALISVWSYTLIMLIILSLSSQIPCKFHDVMR